jgi:hypothetical protein
MVMPQLRAAYFVIANTLLLMSVFQLAACVALRAYDVVVPALLDPPLTVEVERNYAHMSPRDRDELLATVRQPRFRYEPVVGMTEAETKTRFVNVDAHGIRSNGGPRANLAALDGAVWFLGGSTTFGEGIADGETIPAQLERILRRPVINFGVADYASAEENLLLNHYLRIGYRPSLVLVLDGINETCGPDSYTPAMAAMFDRVQRGYVWDLGGPVANLAFRAARKVRKLAGTWTEPDNQGLSCARDGKQFPLSTLHGQLMAERNALCRLYGADCRTLVQPFAGTHGRRDALPKAFLEGDGEYLRQLFQHLEPSWKAAGATFVTDAFDGYERHPFIDPIHYSADASRVIAQTIAKRLAVTASSAATPATTGDPPEGSPRR